MLISNTRILSKHIKNLLKLHKHAIFKSANQNLCCFTPIFTAKLHTSLGLHARVFKDSENVYAYNILQTIPVAPKDLFPYTQAATSVTTEADFNKILDQNWRSKSASEITECFKTVLDYCVENNIDVSDTRFDKLVDGLMDHVQDLTDGNLSDILTCLTKFPACDSYTSHNFHDLWSALDDICCWRSTTWSNESLFVFAEHWYQLNLAKMSDYVGKFIDRILRRIHNFSKAHVVHLFFYIKVHKRSKPTFESQSMVDKYIGDMSIDEIAIIAMGLTRHETKIKLESTAATIISKTKEALPVADNICLNRAFYRPVLGKRCNYSVKFIERLSRRATHLTQPYLIHLFFYINTYRKLPVNSKFVNTLERYLDQLSVDEMAIIAMGFFKTQTPIRVKLVLCAMMDRLKTEIATAHEITITAILKVLRYSSHVLLIDQLVDLLDHLIPEIDRLSNVCCIHAALLGTSLQFFHPKSLAKISEKIVRQIKDVEAVRLKDMERLLLALTMFNFDPQTEPDVFQCIYEEIHTESRRKEFVQYPRCLPSLLNFLSLRGLYSDTLMNEVLDKEHITENYGKHAKMLPRDVFSLDVCIDVERPKYVGNRLDTEYRHKVAKWNVEYTPTWNQYKKLTVSDRFVLDVIDVVTKIVNGHQNLLTEHVLPNYVKSDIIVCKDPRGYFHEPVGFDKYVLGDVMRPCNPDLQWYSIVPVNWNACIRDTSEPLGLVHMKTRQLKAIGYTPILVIWNEFLPLSEKERLDYVRNKIS